MLDRMGDSIFAIGSVQTDRYRKVLLNDTVRAMALASNLDGQPGCAGCTYQPYCGTCPVHNYATQGSIFGRMRENSLCDVYKGIQDYLFSKLLQNDPATTQVLGRWTTLRQRSHFVQPCAASAIAWEKA
jgi:radical SAM protein with 4Fe4S-binding SPASM domain